MLLLVLRDGFDNALTVLLEVNDIFPLAEASESLDVVKPSEVVRQASFTLFL